MEQNEFVFHAHYTNHGAEHSLDGKIYSLHLEFESRHVDLRTFYYPISGGNNINISIYDLTPENMLEIANKIKERALEIKPELKDGK